MSATTGGGCDTGPIKSLNKRDKAIVNKTILATNVQFLLFVNAHQIPPLKIANI
jgi:hypothetical protein